MPYDEPLPPPLPPPLPAERTPAVQTRPVRTASLTPLYIALTILAVLAAGSLGYLARGWQSDPQPNQVALKSAPPPKITKKSPQGSLPKLDANATTADQKLTSSDEPDPAADLVTPSTAPPAEPTLPEAAKPVALPTEVAPEPKPSGDDSTPPAPPVSPSPAPSQTPPAKTSPTLYQELDIQRMPKFGMLGTVTIQDLRYGMLSELKVAGPDDEGQLAVEQVVLDTRLIKSDDLSRAMFESSLAALKGWQFSYKLSSRREVTEWKASPPDGRKVAAVRPKGGEGFLVTSVMDEDGWKELAQLSFFQPQPASGGKSWRRPMQHDFGPLGSWYGETQFTPQTKRGGLQQIAFVHTMEYRPPEKDLGELPFTIEKAVLKPEAAGGTIQFDQSAGRVQSAQESFLVRGSLAVSLLGQSTTVEVEEQQLLTLRLHEQNPWETGKD
jgi:hypothetical protein